MRLTKGSKVEVLIHKDDSIGSSAWRCAEVISGNGRMYEVKYCQFRASNKAMEYEKVPRKAIRPLPPPVFGIDSWVPGNLLEVFHDDSWRTAIFLKHLDENNFSVRLLGFPDVFKVHRSYLRIPQSWENDYGAPAKKSRKDVGLRQSPVFEKVDTFVSPNKISGENFVLYPSNTKSNGFSDAHTGSTIDNSLIDAISCESSVGSCSAEENELSNSYNRIEDYSSDADSSSAWEHKKQRRSHLSDLSKYRRVVESLYSAGSLSWEQEAQMMDLRCLHNISDDEHLIDN